MTNQYSACDLVEEYINNTNIKVVNILDIGCTGLPTFLITLKKMLSKNNCLINLIGIDKNLYLKYGDKLVTLAKNKGIIIDEISIENYANKTANRFDIIFINAPTPGSILEIAEHAYKILNDNGKIYITHACPDEEEQTNLIKNIYNFNRVLLSVGNKWNPKEELIDSNCYMGSVIYGNIYELTQQSKKEGGKHD